MWTDNFWFFSDKKSELKEMMGEWREELRKMEIEPKQETLWSTITSAKEIQCHMKIIADNESWTVPFVEEFDILGHRYATNGKGTKVLEKSLNKGLGSWWRDKRI